MRQDRWGRGLASEAAERTAAFAFDELAAPLLCAVCDRDKHASARMMERLGMQYHGIERWYDMDTAGYRIGAAQWRQRANAHRPPTK